MQPRHVGITRFSSSSSSSSSSLFCRHGTHNIFLVSVIFRDRSLCSRSFREFGASEARQLASLSPLTLRGALTSPVLGNDLELLTDIHPDLSSDLGSLPEILNKFLSWLVICLAKSNVCVWPREKCLSWGVLLDSFAPSNRTASLSDEARKHISWSTKDQNKTHISG